MEPLRVAVVEISNHSDPSSRIAEAAKLYGQGCVDQIFLLGSDFSRIRNARKACLWHCVPINDVIIDRPNLASFVRDSEEGVKPLVVITTWLRFVSAWYRFRKQPKWVWSVIEFHAASIL